jgi:uncharacterized protein YggE
MNYINMRILVIAGLLFVVTLVNAETPNVTCPDGSNPQGRVSVTGQGSVKSLPDSATVRTFIVSNNSITKRSRSRVSFPIT